MKVSSTVRRGADGKEARATSPAAYPTKAAVLGNAAGVIVAHNHRSGDPTPSPDDVMLCTRLRHAADILGIDLLDFVIIGDGGRYYSFKEASR